MFNAADYALMTVLGGLILVIWVLAKVIKALSGELKTKEQ